MKNTHVRSYVDIPAGDEEALKSAVATVGPVSVAISASNAGFMNYGGGKELYNMLVHKLSHLI